MSAMFIFGYDLMTQCDYFNAKRIVVTGNHILYEQQIFEQSELDKNANILSINLSILQEKIRSNPWIKDAEVMRDLPDKLIIRIKEQKPIAVLDMGRNFFINDSGQIFKEKTASDPNDLPVVTGLGLSDIHFSGETSSIAFSAVMDVLQLGQKPKTILPNRLIKTIQVDREIGLTLHMFNDASLKINEIKLGYKNYPNKYDKLTHILVYLEGRNNLSGFDSVDLNNLNRIIVTPIDIEAPIRNNKEV